MVQWPKPGNLRNIFIMSLLGAACIAASALANAELLFTTGWWPGFGCGLATAWAWTGSSLVRRATLVIGCVLLLAMAIGLLPELQGEPRALFQGMSIGYPLGLVVLGWLEWPRIHSRLLKMCVASGDEGGLEWLKRHEPSKSNDSK